MRYARGQKLQRFRHEWDFCITSYSVVQCCQQAIRYHREKPVTVAMVASSVFQSIGATNAYA